MYSLPFIPFLPSTFSAPPTQAEADLSVGHVFVGEGVDVERDEEAVEEVVGQDVIEALHLQGEDVGDVMEMVQVLCHQLL